MLMENLPGVTSKNFPFPLSLLCPVSGESQLTVVQDKSFLTVSSGLQEQCAVTEPHYETVSEIQALENSFCNDMKYQVLVR
jgi:hypothetical protein